MGLFGFGKKQDDVIDLGERLKERQEQASQVNTDIEPVSTTGASDSGSALGFLGNMAGASSTTETSSVSSSESDADYAELGGSIEQRRQRLAKRLMDMTTKLEDLSNQIYHLQQRIEVLEKKSGI